MIKHSLDRLKRTLSCSFSFRSGPLPASKFHEEKGTFDIQGDKSMIARESVEVSLCLVSEMSVSKNIKSLLEQSRIECLAVDFHESDGGKKIRKL